MNEEIPTLNELEQTIENIPNLRDRALCSLLYLTGARVSEIVRRFKVKEISVEKDGERLFYVFNIYIEKRREKKDIYRRVGIPYDKNKMFIDNIYNYIKKYRLKDTDNLFDIHRRTVHRIVKKHFGFRPHFLRHTRATHLTTLYGLSAQELQNYIGWSDIRTTAIYTHLNWKNVSHKL